MLALALGLLALAAGTVDGLAHATVDRLAGDDATAILATLAGGVLVGAGSATPWRTRRLDEPHLRRYLRRGLVAATSRPRADRRSFGESTAPATPVT